MNFFSPILEHFCPPFIQIAQMVSFCPEYLPQPLFFTQPSHTPFGDMRVHKTHPIPPQITPYPGLNLKVGKMNYRLGKLDPNWAKCFKNLFIWKSPGVHIQVGRAPRHGDQDVCTGLDIGGAFGGGAKTYHCKASICGDKDRDSNNMVVKTTKDSGVEVQQQQQLLLACCCCCCCCNRSSKTTKFKMNSDICVKISGPRCRSNY